MIRLLFEVAVGAFVLSLPIHMPALGSTFGRIAGFCFVLALVPSIVVGLFFPGGVDAHPVVVALNHRSRWQRWASSTFGFRGSAWRFIGCESYSRRLLDRFLSKEMR